MKRRGGSLAKMISACAQDYAASTHSTSNSGDSIGSVIDVSEPTAEESQGLSESQCRALREALLGHNVFVTGVAGSGKSHWIAALCRALDARQRPYCRTASTGAAAWQIGGRTLHNFAGVGLGEKDVKWLLMDLARKPDKMEEWQWVRTLILDEVSMFRPAYLAKLDELARQLRRSREPFGGIQLVMVGDFFQLPPVERNGTRGAKPATQYLFQAPLWKQLDMHCCLLTHNFRQAQDPAFQRLLHSVRMGQLSEQDVEQLHSRLLSLHPQEDPKQMTKLCSFREEASRINRAELQALKGPERTFEARLQMVGRKFEMREPSGKELEDEKQKSYPVDWQLTLRPGASVLLCRNLDQQDGLFNGARGTVQDFMVVDGVWVPFVLFENGQSLPVLPQRWEQKDGKRVVSVFEQIPLLLRYAVTVHKCQGLTLRRALVTMDFFVPGQGYVALSRVPTLQDLFLDSLDVTRLTTDPNVLAFYTAQKLLD